MTWAIREKGYSQRHACRLVGLHPKTYRYVTRRSGDEALRKRLRDLASQRRRFGYRRLGLMLERQGIKLSPKKLYRLYREERLTVRKRGGRKRALGTRAPMAIPQARNLRWSLDFVADTLASGRRFRILTLVDDFTRECLSLVVDTSLTGLRVARELDRIAELRGYPCMIVSDNGTELTSNAILAWQQQRARRMALHRTRQTDAEWLCRELQRPAARRVPQRAPVRQSHGRARDHRRMEDRLQHQPTALEPQRAQPTEFADAPTRDKTGTDSPYERGQVGEQVTNAYASQTLAGFIW